ncbi:MAG: hypothetical protein KGI47_01650 [Betaproteobacteria bacterium]|nr:hypothetical protein [Betaproteobacteria bacterium]
MALQTVKAKTIAVIGLFLTIDFFGVEHRGKFTQSVESGRQGYYLNSFHNVGRKQGSSEIDKSMLVATEDGLNAHKETAFLNWRNLLCNRQLLHRSSALLLLDAQKCRGSFGRVHSVPA